MSHISVFRTEIRCPNKELLKQVLNALKQQLQIEEIRDHGEYITVVVNGRIVNVYLQPQLTFETDTYGWRKLFNEFRDAVVQTYVHFALVQRLQQLGYRIDNVQMVNNAIVGVAVKGW